MKLKHIKALANRLTYMHSSAGPTTRLTNDNWYQLFSSPVWFAIKLCAQKKNCCKKKPHLLTSCARKREKNISNWMERISNKFFDIFITWSSLHNKFQLIFQLDFPCTFSQFYWLMNYGIATLTRLRSKCSFLHVEL